MVRHGSAWAAKINGNAYRDYLTQHPKAQKITLTRAQMEAIIRDLCEYSDLHAEATEQATRSAARNATLEHEIRAVCDDLESGASYQACVRALRRALRDWQEDRCTPRYGAHDGKRQNGLNEYTDARRVAYSASDGQREEAP